MKLAIGKNIKLLREEKKVTQEQLATALNISFQAVSKWENDIAIPDTMLLPQIAEFFQVTIDDLFQTEFRAYPNLAIRYLAIYENTHRQEDFISADREFSKLISKGEYSANDLKRYGILYEYHTDYCMKKALELYQKALDISSNLKNDIYYGTLRQRIQLLTRIGRGQEIMQNHVKLLEDEPDNVENYISLIMAYNLNKQNENAINLFEKAIVKWPDNPILYYYGGEASRDIKDYGKAFEYWEKSLEICVDNCSAMYSKAFCYQELGDKENEIKMWEKIITWLESHGFNIAAEWPKKILQSIDVS